VKFTDDQQTAIAAFREWRLDHRSGVFKMWGYAGTGKTTLATHLAEHAGGRVMFGAYTGKAASVMRKKGCADARTIHSMIYVPEEVWVERVINGKKKRVKEIIFHLKSHEDMERRRARRNEDRFYDEYYGDDFQIWDASLVIIDECSMIDKNLAEDLLSFGVPVLVIGDPAQLPPVNLDVDLNSNQSNINGFFMFGQPDAMLREITRQAAESEIIRYSMFIRQGRSGGLWTASKDGEVQFRDLHSIAIDDAFEYDQVICGKNATRHKVNARCREAVGFKPKLPVQKDKLICLKNDKNVMNGEMFLAAENACRDDFDPRNMVLNVVEIDDDQAQIIEKVFRIEDFELPEGGRERVGKWDDMAFGYGYAITCHKAQGSQWGSVLVHDESIVFESHNKGMGDRWLYTAATRAVDKLVIVRERAHMLRRAPRLIKA
jgi:exodeoxyribonuclease-5